MAGRDPLEPPVPGDPVAALQARLGHEFADPALLGTALTHRSAPASRTRAQRTGRRGAGSNERLEFLGDRVLGLVVAEWLYARFPDEPEGDLGARQASLVSREALAPVATAIGLGAALSLAPDAAEAGVGGLANVLADAMEAVLGALYLDGGLEPVRRLVRREWAAAAALRARPPRDPKMALQETLLARGAALPVYSVVEAEGPSHAPVFTVEVAGGGARGTGSGASKREAERMAARDLLERMPARGRRR